MFSYCQTDDVVVGVHGEFAAVRGDSLNTRVQSSCTFSILFYSKVSRKVSVSSNYNRKMYFKIRKYSLLSVLLIRK